MTPTCIRRSAVKANNFCPVLTMLLFGWPLISAATTNSLTHAAPPNIVVFLSDDHTITDSSLYGSTEIRTPNMERIAAAGMTFDLAFVASPSCAPSRAALLTGLMPSRNGAEANHSKPRPGIKKLPAYLQQLGYEVVAFGKVGHYGQTKDYGFDLAKHLGYHEDIAVPAAIKWLDERTSDKPLCLFVGTNWPHVPWPAATTSDPDSVQIPVRHVDTPNTRAARAKYLEAVRTMDRELGEAYDSARDKLGEDTLFIHTSDHGAQWPFGKWTLYDSGIRTPLVISWPGKVTPGVRTQAMVSWVDLLPTIVAAAGGTVDGDLDGRSFLPVLLSTSTNHREAIFAVHSGDGNFNVYPSRSMRTERFKYIRNLHPEFKFSSHVMKPAKAEAAYWPSWVERAKTDDNAREIVRDYTRRDAEELYDLKVDPNELHNLADHSDHQDRRLRMRQELTAWMTEQQDSETVFGTPQMLPREDH